MIRGVNGYNFNPDSLKFKFAIQKLSVTTVLKNDSTNCPNILQSLSNYKNNHLDEIVVNVSNLFENAEDEVEKEISNDVLDLGSISHKEKEVVHYIGGFLIMAMKKICRTCAGAISSNIAPKFIQSKEYYNGSLNYPSNEIANEIINLEINFKNFISNYGIKVPYLYQCLEREKSLNIQNFCQNEHKSVGKLLTEKYYKLRIHYETKWSNEKLNSELYAKRKLHKGLSKNIS